MTKLECIQRQFDLSNKELKLMESFLANPNRDNLRIREIYFKKDKYSSTGLSASRSRYIPKHYPLLSNIRLIKQQLCFFFDKIKTFTNTLIRR